MTDKLRSPEQITHAALAAELHDLLAKCTENQRATYARIVESGRAAGRWPNGVESMTDDDLAVSIRLCQRSLVQA